MTTMALHQLYEAILASMCISLNEQHLFSYPNGTPVTVDQKRLVMPVREVLVKSPWAELMPFHPLSENAVLGESPVLKKVQTFVYQRISEVIGTLGLNLLLIAANTDAHGKMNSMQKKFLKEIPEADAKCVEAFDKLIEKVGLNGNRLFQVYMKRGGVLYGKNYQRVAIVNFPIMDEFDPMSVDVPTKDDKTKRSYSIFGHEMRKKDKEVIQAMLNWLLPGHDNLETYSAGSNSFVAPYFDSLIRAYIKIAKQLNIVTNLFKRYIDDADDILINLDWEDNFENLGHYKDQIPSPLPGNDGKGGVGQNESAVIAPEVAAPAKPTAVATTPAAPVKQGYKPHQADDGSDWNAMVQGYRSAQQPQSPYMRYAVGGNNAPVQQHQSQPYPHHHHQPQQQPYGHYQHPAPVQPNYGYRQPQTPTHTPYQSYGGRPII